jgi:hypothetical protein
LAKEALIKKNKLINNKSFTIQFFFVAISPFKTGSDINNKFPFLFKIMDFSILLSLIIFEFYGKFVFLLKYSFVNLSKNYDINFFDSILLFLNKSQQKLLCFKSICKALISCNDFNLYKTSIPILQIVEYGNGLP